MKHSEHHSLTALRCGDETARTRPTASGGMTLVELLVVIVLVATLVTTAIPVMAPGGDRRAIREAARAVNGFLAGAQARAIQTGRPFGVALRRLSADSERAADNAVCVRLDYVEVPPPFLGFDPNTSRVRRAYSPLYNPRSDARRVDEDIRDESDDVGPIWLEFIARREREETLERLPADTVELPTGWKTDLIPQRFLRPGDLVEVGGVRYMLLARDNRDSATVSNRVLAVNPQVGYFEPPRNQRFYIRATPVGTPNSAPVATLPLVRPATDNTGTAIDQVALQSTAALATAGSAQPLFWSKPQRYKVFRQAAPAGGEGLQLPGGAAIDLQASTVGVTAGAMTPESFLYTPSDSGPDELRDHPVTILFSPEGGVSRFNADPTEPFTTLTEPIALCVGRRELVQPDPVGTPSTPSNPIPFSLSGSEPVVSGTTLEIGTDEAREETELANWLNPDTRWVVINTRTGSLLTIDNEAVDPVVDLDGRPGPDVDVDRNGVVEFAEQIIAALEAAPRSNAAGSR